MEKFLICIMIGCLIVFVFFIIAETIEYMTKSGKGITMTKAGRKKLLTTVLPLGAAAGVLFGIIIWSKKFSSSCW